VLVVVLAAQMIAVGLLAVMDICGHLTVRTMAVVVVAVATTRLELQVV
jgi:hypothetical protein